MRCVCLAALSLVGCTLDARTIPPEPVPAWTVAELRAEAFTGSATLDEVRITSQRTASGAAFYVQDPGGGPGTGMRVELGGILFDWPPPVGTPVTLTGMVASRADGPVLTLQDVDDTKVLGGPAEIVAVPWEEAPTGGDLCVVDDLTVTSSVDPTGGADTDGPVSLGGAFGATPGWRTSGTATGILEGGVLSLRDPEDWTGAWDGAPAVPTTIAAIRDGAHADGTPVVLDDVLQAAPWSRGSQFTVLQAPSGEGLWVDAEGWGVQGAEGEIGAWTGEVRSDGEGLRLRVWTDPDVGGAGAAILGDLVDGDLVELTLTGLSGPDLLGDWTTDGPPLDDRFVVLEDLPDPLTVRGVVREVEGVARVAVIETLP